MKIKNPIISYKIRIYPDKKQEKIINRTLGACRWIYNDFLAKNIVITNIFEWFILGVCAFGINFIIVTCYHVLTKETAFFLRFKRMLLERVKKND